jgi:type IV secretory pathway VirB2 component (pilin)
MQNIKKDHLNDEVMSMYKCVMLGMMTIAFYTSLTTDAHAIGAVMCAWITSEMFVGSLGKAIGTIGVLIVAVGAALGRVSWTMAVTVACGIAAMFSARAIAGSFGGGCP